MSSIDTPNMVLPLAASYNERGVDGYTATIVNGLDQRKINSLYDLTRNAITGQTTLRLIKRPGVVLAGSGYGDNSQSNYLIVDAPGTLSPWVISKEGSVIRASSAGTTHSIVTASTYFPAYTDRTAISGADTVILQLTAAAGTAQRVFYSTSIGSWSEITDSDFTGLVHMGKMEPMDGYLFTLDSMNRIYNSDLNSLANWTPTNYLTKQVQQDLPNGLARLNNQIIAFGAETMEVFANGGNGTGSPLVSVRNLFQRVGLMSLQGGTTAYYAILRNKMYFVGTTAALSNSLGIYLYDGQTATKISTDSIDKMLFAATIFSVTKCDVYGHVAVAFAYTTAQAPSQSWLMYFPEWNEWFEWSSTVFGPVNSGAYFMGAALPSKIYSFGASDNWQDAGTAITTTHQFKLPKSDNARSFMGMCGLKGDTARSTSNVLVEFSDDDWQTFYTAGTIDMTQVQKKAIYQCGSYTDRGVRLTHSNNVEFRVESFLARVS